jgi:hypothetical protein
MTTPRLIERSACLALVITCSDFRFKRAEVAFTEAAGLRDDYDLIARPGAIRGLVAPRDEASRQTLRDEIALLHRVHGFTRVLMLNHVSCRAYDDIATPANERAVHGEHLTAARKVIESWLAGVRAEPYLVAPGTDGELGVTPLVG